MEIEVLRDDDKVFEFMLKGATANYANALRRIAINGVKAFAIDKVTVYENTSSMFDEYIAHRIGLVPLITPHGSLDKDEILFTLEAAGPGTVYSKSLESSDKSVVVANPNIPIIKLGRDQKIRIEGKAVMGSALKHAKFQPGLVTYETTADDEFKFYVETFGQMPPRDIIIKACDAIKENMKEFSKVLKKLE